MNKSGMRVIGSARFVVERTELGFQVRDTATKELGSRVYSDFDKALESAKRTEEFCKGES